MQILRRSVITLSYLKLSIIAGKLEAIYKQLMDRILKLEAEKYDINYGVRQKDFEVRLSFCLITNSRARDCILVPL